MEMNNVVSQSIKPLPWPLNKRCCHGHSTRGVAMAHIEDLLQLHGLCHGMLAVIQRGIPGVLEEHEAKLSSAVPFQNLLDGNEVLEGLGHLATFDAEVPGVEEVVDPLVVSKASLKRCTQQTYHTHLHIHTIPYIYTMHTYTTHIRIPPIHTSPHTQTPAHIHTAVPHTHTHTVADIHTHADKYVMKNQGHTTNLTLRTKNTKNV